MLLFSLDYLIRSCCFAYRFFMYLAQVLLLSFRCVTHLCHTIKLNMAVAPRFAVVLSVQYSAMCSFPVFYASCSFSGEHTFYFVP